jgi:lipopolysaccharide transport system ATP-binding protein
MSSSDVAIAVEHVSKEYKLGFAEPYKALRDVITDAGKAPVRAAARLRNRDATKQEREARREILKALDDVSFEIKRGEVVGLIGANGAGKTTMLKLLARITEPTAGSITLRGRIGSLLEVGTGFHPELTGRENVFLNGSILGMRKAEIKRQFDEIVEFSGVEKFLDTPVKRYSSGMQVRLAFAVAAHLQPEILLVDEVLAVGDAEFQKKCLGKMDDVTKEGRTVVFVSHNALAVRSLCPRSILLEHGRVGFDGPTEETFQRYLHADVATSGWIDGEVLARRQQSRKLYAPEPVIAARAVGILDESGTPRTSFRSDEDITIVVDYECLRPVPSALIRVQLHDETGSKILQADSVDDLDAARPLEAGSYRSTCVIPKNLFGDAHFSVSVYVAVSLLQSLAYNSLLEFDVEFQGFNGNRQSSLLRPELSWSTESVDSTAATLTI